MDQGFLLGLLAALVPLIVAISAGIGAGVNAWLARRREQRAIRAALLAEVRALAEIIRGRQYVDGLEEGAAYLNGGGESYSIAVRVPDHYCRIYSSSPGAVGNLSPEQATKVVMFYQLIDSVVQDVSPGGHLAEGASDPLVLRESKRFLEKALQLADELGSS